MGVEGQSTPGIYCSAAASLVPGEELVRPIVEPEPEDSLGFWRKWSGVVGSVSPVIGTVVCVDWSSVSCGSEDEFAAGFLFAMSSLMLSSLCSL